MTEVTILEDLTDPGYTGRDKISAGLFYYEYGSDNEQILHEYDLLDSKCNWHTSNCTMSVHDERKFYLSEHKSQVEQLFLVVINQDTGNDATLKQPFRVHFERLVV